MKLKSGRQYKNDLSDVIGILSEHQERSEPLTFAQIQRAVVDLYGSWDVLPTTSQSFIRSAMEHPDLREIYARIRQNELESKATLVSFEQRYPGVTTMENVDDILANLRNKEQSKDSLLASLRARKKE